MAKREDYDDGSFPVKRAVGLTVGFAALVLLLLCMGSLIEVVDAGSIVVKQSLGGDLDVWTTAGPHGQWFGNIETYTKSAQVSFGSGINVDEGIASSGKDHNGQQQLTEEQLRELSLCLPIRFNDNGTAKLCGSVSYDLPTDAAMMTKIHNQFRSQDAVVRRIVMPALMKSAYNSGPMMSSRESAGDRRAELLETLREQATVGIYRVEVKETEQEDLFAEMVDAVEMVDAPVLDVKGEPVLNADGTPRLEKKPKVVKRHPMTLVKVVRPKMDAQGKIEIAEPSAAAEFGVRLYNFTINRLIYDDRVKRQIEAQQDATMSIQTARVRSQKAEQDALTSHAEGEAAVAKAKAEQEVEKQRAVTQAEKNREVARLDLEAADFQKQAAIKRAEGEAEARKLVMVADGALDKKLEALKAIHKYWADAAAKQPLVPSVVVGGDGGRVGLDSFMTLRTAELAKDLALDMKVKP